MQYLSAGLKDWLALNTIILLHQIVHIMSGNCRGDNSHANIAAPETIMKFGFEKVQSCRVEVATQATDFILEAGQQQV